MIITHLKVLVIKIAELFFSILKLLLVTDSSTKTTKKNWFQKNKSNLLLTVFIILFFSFFSSINTLKYQENLTFKKLIHIKNVVKNQEIYAKKIKSKKILDQYHLKKLHKIDFSELNKNNESIARITIEWKSIVDYYLTTESAYKAQSTFFNNDIKRKNNSLESAILRYNNEVNLLKKLQNTFPYNIVSWIKKSKSPRLINNNINTNNYITYE